MGKGKLGWVIERESRGCETILLNTSSFAAIRRYTFYTADTVLQYTHIPYGISPRAHSTEDCVSITFVTWIFGEDKMYLFNISIAVFSDANPLSGA